MQGDCCCSGEVVAALAGVLNAYEHCRKCRNMRKARHEVRLSNTFVALIYAHTFRIFLKNMIGTVVKQIEPTVRTVYKI